MKRRSTAAARGAAATTWVVAASSSRRRNAAARGVNRLVKARGVTAAPAAAAARASWSPVACGSSSQPRTSARAKAEPLWFPYSPAKSRVFAAIARVVNARGLRGWLRALRRR